MVKRNLITPKLNGQLLAVRWSTLLGAQYIILLSIQCNFQFVLATKNQRDRVCNLKHRVVRMEVA